MSMFKESEKVLKYILQFNKVTTGVLWWKKSKFVWQVVSVSKVEYEVYNRFTGDADYISRDEYTVMESFGESLENTARNCLDKHNKTLKTF